MADETKLPPPPPARAGMQSPPKKRKAMMGKVVFKALCNIDAGHAYYRAGEVVPDPSELDPAGKLLEGVHWEKGVDLLDEEGAE